VSGPGQFYCRNKYLQPAFGGTASGQRADHPQVSAAVRERPRPTEPPYFLLKGLTSWELVKRGSVLQFTVQGYLSPHAHAFLPLVKA